MRAVVLEGRVDIRCAGDDGGAGHRADCNASPIEAADRLVARSARYKVAAFEVASVELIDGE